MKTRILDYIDFDKVNTLLEGFNQSTGFVTAILDLDGNILSKSGWRKICTEFHRVNPETSLKCTISDTVLAGEMKNGEKYHCYRCLNGMVDVAVPIIIKGEHIANLFSGQFFFEKPDLSYFLKQSSEFGFNESVYLKALEEVPVISEEKVKTIIEFLLNMTQLISDMTFQKMELMELNETLRTNEERYRLVLENSMDAILLASPDGSIYSANPAACNMFQRTEEEICKLGRNVIADLNDPRFSALIEERNKFGKAKGELLMLRKDGTKFPVELSVSVFTDHSGKLLSSVIIRDITDRKISEEQLIKANKKVEESEIHFRLLVENAPEAIFVQVDSRFAYVNKAAINLYGAFNQEQLLGTKIIERIHPDSVNLVIKRIAQLNEEQISVNTAEYKHLRIDNSAVEVSVSAVPFKYQNKNGALVFVKDITDRKHIEEKLKNSYDLLKKLAEQVPGVIYQYRLYPDGRSEFPYSSPGMFNIYEVTSEEVREDASLVFTRIHPDDYDYIVETITESAKNQTEYHSEFRVVLPIQGERWRLCNAKPELLEDGSTLWHGLIMDITDRKRAEELYKEKNEEINTFFDCTLDLLCIANTEGFFIHLNKEWENVLGFSLEEIKSSKFLDFVHPDDILPTLQAINQLTNQDKISNFTNRYRCKNGEYKWIEWKSYPMGNKIYAAARDITELIQQKQDLINAKEKIEKSEEKFRKAFYTNPEAITINSIETGTYVSVNNGFVRMLEYSEEEVLGRSSIKLNIWQDIANRHSFIDILKRDGIIESFEAKLRTKSGKIIDCLVSSAVIELDNTPHILSITRDISYRKRVENELRESKEQLNFAFEGSNDGLWDVNMITGEVYINSRGCEILGYLPNEKDEVAKAWSDLIHPDDLPIANINLQAHIENKTPVFVVEQRLRMKSGDWKWILSRGKIVSRDANGEPLRMTGTHTDISERIAFKEALIQKNMELEASEEEIRAANEELHFTYESLKESNVELEIAKEKAEESSRLKTAFLQNMSHEIRTPMNAIMGFSELLVFNFNNKIKLQNFSEIINQRCNDLLVIIDDILDIAKIESGQLSLNMGKCDINLLFSDLKDLFTEQKKKLNKNHIEFVLQIPNEPKIIIETDDVKLKQIFINLIGNAFKYTLNGVIEAGYKIENSNLVFHVSDTGIGIPLSKQHVIFERFIQLEPSVNRLYGGNGLGLSIVKGLVDLLGGKIWLESELNIGSTFYFSMPFKLEEITEEMPLADDKEIIELALPQKTILVVEDDTYNAAFIKEILEDTSITLLFAQTGLEAVQMATTQPLDLVLMDIGLPDISGYEAIQQIKQEKPQLKIIAQTAYAAASDKQKALESGCVDYISKPLKSDMLLSLINKHLKSIPIDE